MPSCIGCLAALFALRPFAQDVSDTWATGPVGFADVGLALALLWGVVIAFSAIVPLVRH